MDFLDYISASSFLWFDDINLSCDQIDKEYDKAITGFEKLENQENKNIRVSTIDIKLLKTGEIDNDANSKVIDQEPVLQIIKEEE